MARSVVQTRGHGEHRHIDTRATMRTRKDPLHANGSLVYRLILAIDVERYSRLDAQLQLDTQTKLRGVLDACVIGMGLDPDDWHRQVSGDGELMVLPADTN